MSSNDLRRKGKKQFAQSLETQKVNWSLGRPEWQQEIKSTSRIFFDKKSLKDINIY